MNKEEYFYNPELGELFKNPKVKNGTIILSVGGISTDIKIGERVKGLGRWIYCKYCYKNVIPTLLVEEFSGKECSLIVCSECGAGLKRVEDGIL